MNPKGYRCSNCGKMLSMSTARNIMKCEACGSEYKVEDDFSIRPFYVEQIPCDTHELKMCAYVPGEFVMSNPQLATKVTLEKMAHEMAEKILPFLEVDSTYNFEQMSYNLYARLRVHVPRVPLEEQLKRAIPAYADTVEAEKGR